MSNELLNAYIRFGEPDGDDLDFSQIADWAGYLLQEQRERIAELEAELEAVKHDKEGWYNADGYAEIVKRLGAENQRLRDALQEGIETLHKASRMLTDECRGVLMGNAWGQSTIDKMTEALAATKEVSDE